MNSSSITSFTILILALISISSCTSKHSFDDSEFVVRDRVSSHLSYDHVSFSGVKEIFDAKCVACHSCYNSPCQLDLTSYDGIKRGANKISIYEFPSVKSRTPTRIYRDNYSEPVWRDLKFYSVIHPDPQKSILSTLISDQRTIYNKKQTLFKSEESRVCLQETSKDSLEAYFEANPSGAMPFGLPPLNQDEIDTIKNWQELGSSGESHHQLEKRYLTSRFFSQKIDEVESLLNQESKQARLSSRYLFEHLYYASLYFPEKPNVYFRLVRSSTEKGPIIELGTDYPFDHPYSRYEKKFVNEKFYYRLRPIINTLMHKTLIPFSLSKDKLTGIKKRFYDERWGKNIEKLPTYGKNAGNPFITFKDIPSEIRYRFFLENSAYHIMTFIKGPVCNGNSAVNVINDQFWVLFLDPSRDPLVQNKELYKQVSMDMKFPSQIRDEFNPLISFRDHYWSAMADKFIELKNQQFSLDDLWDPDNPKEDNTLITVLRHFDSAHVLKGLVGNNPKTIWVLDYHVFESIYYNLTAGYNVFGPLLHQLNSRLFMEVSRVGSEDLFLKFLSRKERLKLRKEWNLKTPPEKRSISKTFANLISSDAEEKLNKKFPYIDNLEPKVALDKNNFIQKIKTLYLKAKTSPYSYNDIPDGLKKLEKIKKASLFPDSVLVKYESEQESNVYTIINNKDHYNVASFMYENDRRRPENDELMIIKGVATSYPNYFLLLNDHSAKSFFNEVSGNISIKQFRKILGRYGVTRTNEKFWEYYDWFSQKSYLPITNERGLLDLNRYL